MAKLNGRRLNTTYNTAQGYSASHRPTPIDHSARNGAAEDVRSSLEQKLADTDGPTNVFNQIVKRDAVVTQAEANPEAVSAEDFLKIFARGTDVDTPVVDESQESGLSELGLRFKISTANNLLEKLREFKREYPEGDLVLKMFEGDREPVLAFRRTPDDKWARLDDNKAWNNELRADIFDFIGQDLGALIGEIGMAVWRGKGVTIPKLIAKVSAGAFAGDLSQQAIQTARGIQAQPFSEQATQAGGKAAWAGGGTAVMEPVIRGGSKLYRHFRGGDELPSFAMSTGGKSMAKTAERLDLPVPPVHVLSDHPWLARIGRQSSALVPTIRRQIAATHDASLKLLARLSKEGTGHTQLIKQLTAANDAYKKKLLRTLEGDLGFPVWGGATGPRARGVEEVAHGLKGNFSHWATINKAAADTWYAAARKHGDPVYDLTALRGKIKHILERNKGALVTENVPSPGSKIVDQFGRPLDPPGSTVVPQEVLVGSGTLDPAVKTIFEQLSNVADIATRKGTGVTPTQQLQKWAGELAPYMMSDYARYGITKASHELATQGFRAIKETLEQVKNTNPKFLAAHKKANAIWSDRMNVLKAAADARNADDPIGYLRAMYGSQATQRLRNLKAAMTPHHQVRLTHGYVNDLLSPGKIDNLSKTLKNMSPEFRAELFDHGYDKVLVKFADQWDKLKRLDVAGRLAKQDKFSAIMDDFAREGSSAQITQLMKLVAKDGGRDSALGRNLRAGLLDNIMNRVTVLNDQGFARINPDALFSTMKDMQKTGITRLLTRDDRRTLHQLVQFEKGLAAGGGDVGTSMQAASVSARLGQLDPEAILHLAKAVGWGRIMTSKSGRKWLLDSAGRKMSGGKSLGALGGVIATIMRDDARASERKLTGTTVNKKLIRIIDPDNRPLGADPFAQPPASSTSSTDVNIFAQ